MSRNDLLVRHQRSTEGLPIGEFARRYYPNDLHLLKANEQDLPASAPTEIEARSEQVSPCVGPNPKPSENRALEGATMNTGSKGTAGDSNGGQTFKERNRDYMRSYRKKWIMCPHCKKTFKEIKRVDEEVK